MADYIYLLENRLAQVQKEALASLRQVARSKGLTLFLVGGAVRDLTSGSPVRDLDVAVQGNALKLRKDLELAGAAVGGSSETLQALYLRFPGGVRVEIASTLSATYPKPAKPVFKPGTILEDLRRRDFTCNAMALSLNEGSYGLLMDPLNGVADIENRELRLVSNYGFIEEPVRLIRASRFSARLGWSLEEKTQGRYETAKQEGYISGLSEFHRGYEAEELVHEEDPLRVMRRLESEGWMQVLSPAWNAARANVGELEKVRESQTQLQLQGIHPDASAINFPLLTARMNAKDVEALKKSFPRQGFVLEIDRLEADAKAFAAQLGGKQAVTPSSAYRLLHSASPEAVLYVAYTTKSGALLAKFKSFFGEWPQARQRIPYVLMQEMRITPEIAGYRELVDKVFFELMDGNLTTTEEMRAFLEPYSPPAPPPPVHLRRARTTRKDAKKGRLKKGATVVDDDAEDAVADDDEIDNAGADMDGDEDGEEEGAETPIPTPRFNLDVELGPIGSATDEEDEEEDGAVPPGTLREAAEADDEGEADEGDESAEAVVPSGEVAGKAAGKKATGGLKGKAEVAGRSPSPVAKTPEGRSAGLKNALAKSPAAKTAVKVVAAKAPAKPIPAKAAAKAVAVKAIPAKTVQAVAQKKAEDTKGMSTTGAVKEVKTPAKRGR